MFEIIGLLFGIVFFFVISCIAGGGFALVAWLILRSQGRHRRRRIVIAACLPPVFAAYVLACAVAFSVFVPGESGMLFGDISEPLPNGYVLTALGKMPRYGTIEAPSAAYQPTVTGYIGSLEVDGPLVFGSYSRQFGSSLPEGTGGNQGYFAFDTRNGSVLDFGSLAELNRHAGHSVQLVETGSFRSAEASHRHLVNVERGVWIGPPLICTVLYFLFLLRVRRGASHTA